MHAVEVVGLVKTYGEHRALDGLDLVVPRGSVVGVLGPNGAGKTTAVKILSTLLRPDGGRALVDGIDVAAHPAQVRARIGLTGQYAAVDERLTGKENLELVGRHFHLGKREAKARAGQLLSRFDLVDAGSRVAKGYSGGMRRRLDIAMSLISRPSVLFLDEPTTGLDPRSRMGMWELIEELGNEGTTTLLTTQYLDEADRLADNIVVIDQGKAIAEGTVDQLKDQIGGDRLSVSIARRENLGLARDALSGIATGVIEVDEQSLMLHAPITAGGGVVPAAIRALDEAGADVLDVTVRRPTLDDVFLALTGKGTNETDPSGDARG